ncbi:MAG: YihY/virulence factor BrkB family protein [Candidatus Pacebacteria bacterium]|nr:YihY/virulence factor BrkB family protein [Candidatus Paceibacterota bacterium]
MAEQRGRNVFQIVRDSWIEARRFFREELWDMDLSTLPKIKTFGLSLIRVTTIVVRGFAVDRCTLQASALTYYSLMALVPIVALMLSVSKGLGAQQRLMELIGVEKVMDSGQFAVQQGSRLAQLPEEAHQVVYTIFNAVENTNFGALGAIGLGILFWTVIKGMGKIENAFNDIWGVHEPRSLLRKFADYVSVLVMVPVMVLLATSVNALLSSDKVTTLLEGKLGPLYYFYEKGLGLSGLFFIILAFVFLYMFMPNTKVRLFPALTGGFVGGGLWYAAQGIYFMAQVGLAQKNAIYGTFAAIPFFIFWVYLSWVVVLFGDEIAFAIQNYKTYVMERRAEDASFATRQMLAMLVVYDVSRAFYNDHPSWDPHVFSEKHHIPVRLVTSITSQLSEAHVLIPTAQRDPKYVPGKDIGRLTLADVEKALRGPVSSNVAQATEQESDYLKNAFQQRFTESTDDISRTTMRDILEKEKLA